MINVFPFPGFMLALTGSKIFNIDWDVPWIQRSNPVCLQQSCLVYLEI